MVIAIESDGSDEEMAAAAVPPAPVAAITLEESDEEEIDADVATFMNSVGNSHMNDQ